MLVGAPGVDDDGDGAGAAYTFNLSGINTDSDGDNIADPFDNCPSTANSDQADLDGDGIGNVCDDDIDGDGHNNGTDILATYPAATYPSLLSSGDDKFSLDPTEWADTDGDGIGDNIDPDADGDGIPDRIESAITGLDLLNASDASSDLDGDGYTNLQEYLAGTAINDINDTPPLFSQITPSS